MLVNNDELKNRILAVLDEAGEENFSATANTVQLPLTTEALNNYQTVLLQMLQSGEISIARPRVKVGRLTPLPLSDGKALVLDIGSILEIGDVRGKSMWVMKQIVELLLTESGRQQADVELRRRGYDWWRQPNQ
jgi:hypothetical protein